MTTNRIQAAQKLIAVAEIQSISLLEAKLSREPQQAKATAISTSILQSRLTLNISHSGTAAMQQEGAVRATVRFGLEAWDAVKKGAKAAFRVAASFELIYNIPADLDPSRQELRAFAETNAVFNAWPYWREFAQGMTTRMSLPPLTLPLFRIAPRGNRPHEKPIRR